MIPQSVKDILSNGSNVGFYQTLAMLFFLLLFVGIVWYVFSRSKRHYDDVGNAPLDDPLDDGTDQKNL